MAGSINKVILIGNIGKDPEIRTTNDGREIASLTLATSESWNDKNSGERKEKTEWHRISCFSPGLVNVIKNYVKKGSKVYIEGQLQTRKWQDQNGQDKYTTEVVLQGYNGTLTMLDSRNSGGGASSSGPANDRFGEGNASSFSGASGAGTVAVADDLDDEIPF